MTQSDLLKWKTALQQGDETGGGFGNYAQFQAALGGQAAPQLFDVMDAGQTITAPDFVTYRSNLILDQGNELGGFGGFGGTDWPGFTNTGGNVLDFPSDPFGVDVGGGFLNLPPISLNFPSLPSASTDLLNALSNAAGITSTQKAPKQPLLGGACPPGRIVRHQKGRNICMKKPHMNVLNPHALSRASRRVSGFMKRVKTVEKSLRHAFAGSAIAPHRRQTRGGCIGCGAKSRRACTC